VDWRTFRQPYIAHGGDGLYGSCLAAHLEPIFQTMEFFGLAGRAPYNDPRYRGNVKGYSEMYCPYVESFRKRLCQFRTGMQTLKKEEAAIDPLHATIRHYS